MGVFFSASYVLAFVPFAETIRIVLVTSLPWLLLRLVGHFREVDAKVMTATKVLPIGFAIWNLVLGDTGPFGGLKAISQAYIGVMFALVAILMAREAHRSVGVRARRLIFASCGTATFALASSAFIGFLIKAGDFRRIWYPFEVCFDTATIICYFFAFSPPRGLTTRWRRAEQNAHIAETAEREPEERGARAADDLIDGANRCIGGALTFVAMRPDAEDGSVSIVASTQRALIGRAIGTHDALLARVLTTGVAELSRPLACEPEVAAVCASSGVAVLAAPIVAGPRTWGVVAVVHRRGALFPDDDLSALAQLARHAATSLDHAALVVERRERARQVSERRLRELESRVGLMLDSITDYAMLVLDGDGIVAAWHLGAQHVFGHSREQIARQSGAALFDMTSEEFLTWLADARASGVAEREGVCRRFDGQTFVGATTIRPLVPEPDAPSGFAVVTRDVTERRNLEERLRQGQKMQAIGQLAGGVAHDFNNLLTAVLGYSDWLVQDLAGDPRVDQVIEIQRAAERAADLTRRLLAFSRRQMVQAVVIDVVPLIASLLPMLQRLIGESITIADVMSPSTSCVMGDRSQLEQVVLNLVLNARDALPRGGQITIRTADVWCDRVTSSLGLSGPHVLLEVSDTGVGMDAETRRRAFEPFFTTKPVGRGTGLGLSTVYGIVQQMGGDAEIISEPGRGATFRLYFPQASPAARAAAPPAPGPSPIATGEFVLLVEDDEMLRPFLIQVLQGNGYRVLAAENSDKALSLVESLNEPIDLVISDVIMPGRTGPELVAELLRSRPGLPALYISGHAEGLLPPVPAQTLPMHLLQKPFSSTDLLTKVREILAAA
jgi:PAS domain S-box-containing protein